MDNNIIDISNLPQVEQDVEMFFQKELCSCLEEVSSEIENRLNLYTSFNDLAEELTVNISKADKIVPRDFIFGLQDWMTMYEDDFFMQVAGIPGIPYCTFMDETRTYLYTIYSILFNAEDELPSEGEEADFGMTVLKTKIGDPSYVEVWKTDGFWEKVEVETDGLSYLDDTHMAYESDLSHRLKVVLFRDDIETTLLKALITKYGRVISDEEYEKEREKYMELISKFYFGDCFFDTDGTSVFLRGENTYGYAIEPSENGYKLYQYITVEDLIIADIISETDAEDIQNYKRLVCEAKTLDEISEVLFSETYVNEDGFEYDMIIPLGIDTSIHIEEDDFNEKSIKQRAREQGKKLTENERKNLNALCSWVKRHIDPINNF